jgi:NAD(P)-dependent dehydrogenase (short-subunit alcohol dehydrogenase family)
VAEHGLDPLISGSGGTRVAWAKVPEEVRASIKRRAGLAVKVAESQPYGFSPALAARLNLVNGGRLFVKAIGPDDQTGGPGGQESYRREAEVVSRLPATAPVPRLVDHWEAGGWVALLFEDIEGQPPALPWRRGQLDIVLAALGSMVKALTPSPLAVPAASNPGSAHWSELADDPVRLAQVAFWSPWAAAHVQALRELEARVDEALVGGTLLHFDFRADNILLAGNKVYFVDWPHARVGAAWVDLAYLLPSVEMQGGPGPQELFWRHPLAQDVSDLGDVERMVAEVEAEMGPVDLLVNNAGVFGLVAPLVESGPDEWWQTMEVNVRGLLYCSLAVLRGMVERGHGRIVNLASGLGFVASPRLSSYCVSEAALLRLTESLAVEARDHGVHAFAVVPGLVRTAVAEDGASSRAPGTAEDLQALFERGADVPPQRAAEVVVRIASGEADALSGRYIEVPNPLAPTREDLAGTVARAKEIIERDLFVLRDRE